jgi:hypothetical protein
MPVLSTKQPGQQKLLERAEVVANTVISQQPFYASAACTANQRQLLETMVGAAIWYFPQGEELWTGGLSIAALAAIATSEQPKKVKLTKDHHYPRKVAAAELFCLDWSSVADPAQELASRYEALYGQFNYVLPEENKRLVKYQKAQSFISPADAYRQAEIELRTLSRPLFKAILDGETELVRLVINGEIE